MQSPRTMMQQEQTDTSFLSALGTSSSASGCSVEDLIFTMSVGESSMSASMNRLI
ncbi:MAG: hypothetical protein QXG05_08160 [Nitrososphaerota archaeon]